LRSQGVDTERSDAIDRGLGDVFEQAVEVGVLACHPAALGEHGEQHVLAVLGRIWIAPVQAERS
jgi:hypothetical protein